MKSVKKLIVLAVCLFVNGINTFTYASTDSWIELERARVSFDKPHEWKTFKKLLGFPLVLTSPQKNKARIVIGITPSDIKDYPFVKNNEPNSFQDNAKTYKNDAKKWMSNKSGMIKEFFPYKKEKWKNTGDVHHYGFRYNLGEIAFVEHSYYLLCQKQLFHIKTLYRENEFKKDEGKIKNVLNSFNCQSKVRSFK